MNVTREEGNRRLLVLAKFLREVVPDDHWDYSVWTRVGARFSQPNASTMEDLLHGCGTAACALGWACVIPEFTQLGLQLGPFGNPLLFEDGSRVAGYDDAGQVFFGLSEEDTGYLFMGEGDDGYDSRDMQSFTREEVAQRIEDWVAGCTTVETER